MSKCNDTPWERQKGESEKAFEAFRIYRDSGDTRADTAVAEKLQKSVSLIRRWKNRWNWKERAKAFDNEVGKRALEQAIEGREKMLARYIEIAVALREKAFEAYLAMPLKDITPRDVREIIKLAFELDNETRGGKADIKMKKNNLLEAIVSGTMEDINTSDLPELQQETESDADVVE